MRAMPGSPRPIRLVLAAASLWALAACDAATTAGSATVPCDESVSPTCDCGAGALGSTICRADGSQDCDCESAVADGGVEDGGGGTTDVGVIDRDTDLGADADAGSDAEACEEQTWWPDNDGDNVGAIGGEPVRACEQPDRYAPTSGDCDDDDAFVFPGAGELCDDVDNNCDGRTDETSDRVAQYVDGDGDGFGERGSAPIYACERVEGRSLNDRDCDDLEGTIFPGASEVCDGIDNDCDGNTDDGLALTIYWPDTDDDGFGDEEATPRNACAPVEGFIDNGDDCDDEDETINPDGEEVCDLQDNDCDGVSDEDTGLLLTYPDEDGDGFGNNAVRASYACTLVPGYVTNNTDCDDGDLMIAPGTAELCDGIDNDCDGDTDEFAGDRVRFYADLDGDGFGGNVSTLACAAPASYTSGTGDCDDRRNTVYPAAEELCDGLDNNCDLEIDEGVRNACGSCGPAPTEICGDELDNDCNGIIDDAAAGCFCDGRTSQPCYNGPAGTNGIGVCTGGLADCSCPGGGILCNDGTYGACVGSVLPSAELCDGVDNDCDGQTDEGLRNACGECGAAPAEVCDGIDNNCDGQTDEGLRLACGLCPGEAPPEEVCGDGLDNDCDSAVDEACVCTGDSDPCYPGDPTNRDIGACVSGTRDCYTGDAITGRCIGYVLPSVETCDDIDNDCDGQVDIGPDGCSVCGVTAETCDGVDNDCDGQIDEFLRNGCGTCLSAVTPEEAGGRAACDGIDNDCDGLTDENLVNACGLCDAPCYTEDWTDDSDFNTGESDGVAAADGLRLNANSQVFNDLWIANSADDTVSRFDTERRILIGTYPVGINAGNGNDSPSRTAVDFDGNSWVANRAFGGTVNGSIAKVRGGDCVTDCVIASVRIGGTDMGLRALAIDPRGYVWVGSWNGRSAYRVDPDTLEVRGPFNLGVSPYGFAVDREGILWVANINSGTEALAAFDTNTETLLRVGGSQAGGPGLQPYGIAIDANGDIWLGNWTLNGLVFVDRDEFLAGRGGFVRYDTSPSLTNTRGVAIDRDGFIWIASSGSNRVGQFDPVSRTFVRTVAVCSQPTGVGIDSSNNVWTNCLSDGFVNRINRTTFTVDTSIYSGGAPYSYSDLTGFQVRNFTAPRGFWRSIFDCGVADCSFDGADWASTVPAGTTATVRFRTSADQITWSDWTPAFITLPVTFDLPTGRYCQVEVEFTSSFSVGTVTPVVDSITLDWQRP
jgi:streptogramin lyase